MESTFFSTPVWKVLWKQFDYKLYIVKKPGYAKRETGMNRKGGNTMVKGVNRKVIEINRPDSAYFERAVLYLRPEVSEVPLSAAHAEAEDFLAGSGTRQRKRSRAVWFLLGMLSTGVTAGAVVLALLL